MSRMQVCSSKRSLAPMGILMALLVFLLLGRGAYAQPGGGYGGGVPGTAGRRRAASGS